MPTHPSLVAVFQRCFLDLLADFEVSEVSWMVDDGALSQYDPAIWLDVAERVPSSYLPAGTPDRVLYGLVHDSVRQSHTGCLMHITDNFQCRSYRSCNRGCKRWREAISKLPKERWQNTQFGSPWSSVDLLREGFDIKRTITFNNG